jgi:uncharacterized RDD family membrane protein YckC
MQEENPYQSPLEASAVECVVDPQSLAIASASRRFFNLILDSVGYLVVFYRIAIGFILLDIPWIQSHARLSAYGFLFVYYVLQELLFGRTIGKWITGTKVVAADGTMPSPLQIFGRTLCRFLPFEPLSFLSNISSKPVGWHDLLSKTRVILVRGTNP